MFSWFWSNIWYSLPWLVTYNFEVIVNTTFEEFVLLIIYWHRSIQVKYSKIRTTWWRRNLLYFFFVFQAELRVHAENNSPFLTVTSMERIIELSHWGNIAVEEHIEMRHTGANLKGPFSRYDYQRAQDGVSSIKSFKVCIHSHYKWFLKLSDKQMWNFAQSAEFKCAFYKSERILTGT